MDISDTDPSILHQNDHELRVDEIIGGQYTKSIENDVIIISYIGLDNE